MNRRQRAICVAVEVWCPASSSAHLANGRESTFEGRQGPLSLVLVPRMPSIRIASCAGEDPGLE